MKRAESKHHTLKAEILCFVVIKDTDLEHCANKIYRLFCTSHIPDSVDYGASCQSNDE